MRLFLIWFVVFLFITIGNASAGQMQEIELSDGSVVTGEVLSLSQGVYTIKSGVLGTIKLEKSNVKVIRPQSASRGEAAPNTVRNEIQTLQGRMMSDQEIMGLILSLQNDPEFRRILEDPDILDAVNRGDVAALTANPRFLQLLNNSKVREIQKKIK
jgi:hypothetical protein